MIQPSQVVIRTEVDNEMEAPNTVLGMQSGLNTPKLKWLFLPYSSCGLCFHSRCGTCDDVLYLGLLPYTFSSSTSPLGRHPLYPANPAHMKAIPSVGLKFALPSSSSYLLYITCNVLWPPSHYNWTIHKRVSRLRENSFMPFWLILRPDSLDHVNFYLFFKCLARFYFPSEAFSDHQRLDCLAL